MPSLNVACDKDNLWESYLEIRKHTENICQPLDHEDYGIQSMADVSPPKWHLAHTSWFFETFLLATCLPDYRLYQDKYDLLFNSYYNTVGKQWPQEKRGLLSHPRIKEIYQYRRHVDEHMAELIGSCDNLSTDQQWLIITGLHHEQQHQELLLTDLKYNFGNNIFHPPYISTYSDASQNGDIKAPQNSTVKDLKFIEFKGQPARIGADFRMTDISSISGFVFDCETSAHDVYLHDYALADRLVTNGEYLDFIADKGYQRHELWLSEGWNHIQKTAKSLPLYWRQQGKDIFEYQLLGLKPLNLSTPVCHLSFYEACAYSNWAGMRLPTEAEWEHAAANISYDIHCPLKTNQLHPRTDLGQPDGASLQPRQMYGHVWQWTSSAFSPYPGFKPLSGAIGEYNGKFMCGQFVLRGSSTVTSFGHTRPTYRNFFYPVDCWQFTGLRLAKNI